MRPLEGLRILAVEQYGAGPWATLQLADLGADIIKIEDPATGGDIGRYVPPYQDGEDSLFFQTFNRNKRSISLDLANAAGRGVFERLVERSDAVFSNLRGDVPERLRLRYADLGHLNPAIVSCSLSGFGMTGPRRRDPGYDYIVQGLAGWMSLTGEPESPPAKTGLSLVDFAGGYVAALALLAAVHSARRDGIGTDCDVSLFDTAVSLLNYQGTWVLTEGYVPHRIPSSAHPSLVPFQNFRTADGWIVVACPKQKFFDRLAAALDLPELVEDPRFTDFEARLEHRESLEILLNERLSNHPTAFWLDVLSDAGVPVAPVNDVPTALVDPHVEARNLVLDIDHPRIGPIRSLDTAARVGAEGSPRRPAPDRGADTKAVLAELLGADDTQLETWTRSGAFGQRDGTGH